MIKKIKQVCMKNKVRNQNEFIQEEVRKINLDDKKSKLRSEILKHIDEDKMQKEILKEEWKKAEELQMDIINKKTLEESIVNKFHEKDFFN